MRDDKGETRRERNERLEHDAPPRVVSERAEYLWQWYEELRGWVSRVRDGVCELIPPSEFEAWSNISGYLPLPEELRILHEMDKAFAEEINIELQSYRQRQADEQKQAIEKAKRK